ncbi:sodium/glutamate symporter [Oceanobacillus jeddahense]|uniref:Sodium:glutamate symporter n=1 Tax=Oceanobacillus jeddahense TaxID=1462527 RepID=A0ABY5JXM1_9BACI|nr:sodium:glutamate symporter [Oceanobacillus jeddahense]UUI03309.1 sodium:glutamate symporter [Oceanobacillus jeddahense]
MEITVWDLVMDIGLVSLLLLIGIILRAKISFLQRIFMPASFIAGILGLALGPNGIDVIPFSALFESYPGVLLAVVFGAIPLGAAKFNFKKASKRIRNMWIYSVFFFLLLYGVGVLISEMVFTPFFNIPVGFGLILGAGFIGGHGSAAAIGQSFEALGWHEATTLGYTSATVGMLVAIVGGMLIIKRGSQKKETSFISRFDELPKELRTGLVPTNARKSMGNITFSPNSVDPLFVHLAFMGLIVMLAYFLQQGLESLMPNINLPLFSFAILIAIALQAVLRITKGDQYVDKNIIDRISGTGADLIVVFGIASINISVVLDYAVPLIILFIIGVIIAYITFRILAPKMFHQHWFENGIFGWGWTTGTLAMGIALLRIVDPELKSTALEDYGIAYLGLIPFEIFTLTFAPMILMAGFGWTYILLALVINVSLIMIAVKRGWLVKKKVV